MTNPTLNPPGHFAETIKQYQYNDQNIITSPGRFEGCHKAVLEYWNWVMEGIAETLVYSHNGDFYNVLNVNQEEREFFELPPDAEYVALEESDQGFISIHFWTTAQYEEAVALNDHLCGAK